MKAGDILAIISAAVCAQGSPTSKAEGHHEFCNSTLRSSVHRDNSDPVFARLMECPTGLHGCSEEIVSCSSRTYEVTCSCSSNCQVYGDCCWDVALNTAMNHAAMPLSSCVKLNAYASSTLSIYMVVSCPPTWAMDSVRRKCENADKMNDTFFSIPVTSVRDITYR
ncbi:hypothetical protein HPB50_013011 [Hyalomma asiaticum]|uniref:Uncharacterized protein n=1 Tax=Hyalomma asiaticum TaxID=266040 RepID=A0ACB7TAD2_HYAAI|nr:hypothetical protein HPB50_013011 [Hyalomma asiaticum]